jgi:hypothetical protein
MKAVILLRLLAIPTRKQAAARLRYHGYLRIHQGILQHSPSV